MTRVERAGLDLAEVLRASDRGEGPIARTADAPITDRPIAAAQRVLGTLATRGALDRRTRNFAIAADLITGRLGQADAKIAAITADERPELERFLARVWGVGHAPVPPGFDVDPESVTPLRGGAVDGLQYFREVMKRQWQAWRVVRAADHVHVGSAAVVNGAWFAERLAGRSLVLTCAHVCSTFTAAAGQAPPLAPVDAALDWVGDEPSERLRPLPVQRLVWQSPPDEFDAALLEVDGLPAEAHAAANAPTAEPTQSERIYVWGYRQGQAISLSIEDNKISEVNERYFYYTAFSESGVSGAPVFYKNTHELVGLHRGEDTATEVRHAVFFQQVLRAARRALKT